MTNATTVRVSKVEILKSEASELHAPQTFSSWEEADKATAAIASQAGAGALKTWFRVTWADGETYEGKIDVREGASSLRDHVARFCGMHSGRVVPVGRDRAQWDSYLAAVLKPGQREDFGRLLDVYEM